MGFDNRSKCIDDRERITVVHKSIFGMQFSMMLDVVC